jgi:hypothetical protein
MPNPGWLQIGLCLIRKEDPHDLVKGVTHLCRVVRIIHEFIELEGLEPGFEGRTKIDYLHQFYQAPGYFECDDCCRKPGIPTLCGDCLRRRNDFYTSGSTRCDLPRFCSRPYTKYSSGLLPMEFPIQERPKDIPSRYKRPWVI